MQMGVHRHYLYSTSPLVPMTYKNLPSQEHLIRNDMMILDLVVAMKRCRVANALGLFKHNETEENTKEEY